MGVIAELLYDELCYAYCDNCRNAENEENCDFCYRKYQNWGISRETAQELEKRIKEKINNE